MSIEAFFWNYADGQPIGFDFNVVRDILATQETTWDSEYGCLAICF